MASESSAGAAAAAAVPDCEAGLTLREDALPHMENTISDCESVVAAETRPAETPSQLTEIPLDCESPPLKEEESGTGIKPAEDHAPLPTEGAAETPSKLEAFRKWIATAPARTRAFVIRLPQLIWQYKFELLVIILFVALATANHKASVVFLVMEVLFDLSLALALLFKAPRFRHFGLAFGSFLVNRVVSLAMPTAVLVYAVVWREFGSAPWVTYAVVAVDYAVTLLGFFVFFPYFMPVRVREATAGDLEALLEIERAAFSEEDQRASGEAILRRIRTAPGTVLVAELFSGEAVGSLFLRPVSLAEVEARPPSWAEVANGSDFTYRPGHHDALYAVGLQGKPSACKGLSTFLLSEAMACLLRMKLRAIYGGLRVPQYHAHPEVPLQEYVHSGRERLLAAVLKSLPPCTTPTVLCGVEGYWPPDDDSLGCAALVAFHNPICGWPRVAQALVASTVVPVAQCLTFLRSA